MACPGTNQLGLIGDCEGETITTAGSDSFSGEFCRKHMEQIFVMRKIAYLGYTVEDLALKDEKQRKELLESGIPKVSTEEKINALTTKVADLERRLKLLEQG